MGPLERARLKHVAVLDVEGHADRRLAETIRAAGFHPIVVESLEALQAALAAQEAAIAAVAFESLWPDPQKPLRALRDAAPHARLIVAVSEGSPRRRLAERLWSVGLFDFMVSHAAPPHQLGVVLRQAFSDALLESASFEGEELSDPRSARFGARLRFLRALAAAFVNQRRADGLVRELVSRIPQLLEVHLFALVVIEKGRARFHAAQSGRVDHAVLWELAEELSVVAAPYAATPFGPEDLAFADPLLMAGASEAEPPTAPIPREKLLTLPLVLGGELVGCLGLVLVEPASGEQRGVLQLVAHQLASSLKNVQALAEVEEASLVDELTGAHNRRYLERVLDSEWRRARRYKLHLSLVLIDVDHFRQVNDRHGHAVGDEVLRALARLLREALRDTDHVIRFGGEEFLLILPETAAREAVLVAERIRLLFGRSPVLRLEGDGPVQLSLSAGVASFSPADPGGPEGLLRAADEALTLAKRTGRDRVCLASREKFKELARPDGGAELRRHPRLPSNLKVSFIELPDFEPRRVEVETTDLSAGGVALKGSVDHLKRNAYALVFLEGDRRPQLSRVVWTEDTGQGQSAGLKFVRSGELAGDAVAASPVPRALVVLSDAEVRGVAERVVTAAGYKPLAVAPDDGELGRVRLEEFGLLVLGQDLLRTELGARLEQVRRQPGHGTRVIVISENGDRRRALEAIHSGKLEHLVNRESASEALFATLTKFLLGEYFGVKKYLMWGAVTRTWSLKQSAGKGEVLEGLRDLARSVNCHPRLADLLVAAVDEMIINALFRPSVESEKARRPVTVECGSDGRLLAVAVRDEYGQFRQEDLFRGIGEALKHEQNGLSADAPQASLGFRIMLSTLSQLAVNVDPGRCTEIIGIIDLRKSLREVRAAAPSLDVFTKPARLPEG